MKRLFALTMCVLMLAGCGGGSETVAPTGNSIIKGTVESFDGAALVVSKLAGAVPKVLVSIYGPTIETGATDEHGDFEFTDLPPGEYTISFMYNYEEVFYQGNDGQKAKVTLEENQEVLLTDVKVSGGQVDVGSIKVYELDSSGNVIDENSDTSDHPPIASGQDSYAELIAGNYVGTFFITDEPTIEDYVVNIEPVDRTHVYVSPVSGSGMTPFTAVIKYKENSVFIDLLPELDGIRGFATVSLNASLKITLEEWQEDGTLIIQVFNGWVAGF